MAGANDSHPYPAVSFRLDASGSYDPDALPGDLAFSWTCVDSNGLPCRNSFGSPLVLPASAGFSLPGGSLAPGSYEFSVIVSKDTRGSIATLQLLAIASAP